MIKNLILPFLHQLLINIY